MRLSGIKLAGFKSFVDPTALPLPANLTSVVGPNGCGKSNIIDAVRWVLGETSMKQLRGQDSEDVIFNGSKSRKPVGRASVELTFDNAEGKIQGPYSAYAEIAVRRELARDGSSQYYLNGRKSLKRDVTDLFLGTGLGGRNQYAIIEQGMVSRMIEAKPEELRTWLEEAAGISKYKDRRRETETRIRQTRENLARLNDLRSEIQQRLEVLRRQAANAEKYKEFKQQERSLKAQILALRERALNQQAQAHERVIEEHAAAVQATRQQCEQADLEKFRLERQLRDRQSQVTADQGRVFEADAALAQGEQSLTHAREMRAIKQRELDQIQRQLADLERRQLSEKRRQEDLQREVEALQLQHEHAEEAETQARNQLADAERAQAEEQSTWETFQQSSEQPLFESEGQRVRVQALERAQFQLEERHRRMSAELAGLNPQALESSLQEADTELADLAAQIGHSGSSLQVLDQDLQQLREQRSGVDTQLHEVRQKLQAARGRLASLETLQQAAMRQDDADLNRWLGALQLDGLPRLAQNIEVAPGWESAVEHVLEGLLQAPLVEQLQGHRAQSEPAPKSGVTLIDAELRPAAQTGGTRLSDRVRGPQALTDLLQGVLCADTADEALRMLAGLQPQESVIGPDGVWRGRGWLRHPRRDSARGGVLARAQLIKQLGGQVTTLAAEVATGEDALADLRARQHQAEAERRELAARLEQARGRQAQRMAHRQAQAVRLEQLHARIKGLRQELEGLSAQREQQQQELAATRAHLQTLEAAAERLRQERAGLQQRLSQARERIARARQTLTQTSQARNQLQIQLASRSSALVSAQQGEQALLEALQATRDSLAERGAEIERLEAPLQQQGEALEAARQAVHERKQALQAARDALAAVEQSVLLSAQRRQGLEQARENARERLQQARLDFENLRARREGLRQQFLEACAEGDLEPQDVLEALTETSSLDVWEDKLAQLIRRIDRLGAINLAAIQELQEAEGRDNYLAAQDADLCSALDALEQAIRKIDAETKERFKTTYDQVNRVFTDRFPKLFGGGEAYLELTADDLLDAGVRVMARPPGKRNSSIQMLSGGEKAMTAVALLLALFQLNPAPFCLMDEVDAPLDDANVGRFCEVVREMSENVQFIIITHNKITMELATHLHGVTMQEPGVSRLVSVDVQRAVELATENLGKE